MNDNSQALAAAVQFHQAGNLPDAERLCREVLSRQPNHPAALDLLGIIALQQRRPAEAIELIAQAVEATPDNVAYLTHLGRAHAALQQWDQAANSLYRAAATDPNDADAQFHLGIVQRRQRLFDHAAASFERSVALDPARVEAHYNLGNTWIDLGRFDQAERCYREAIRLRPEFLMALSNLGNVLHLQGRLEEAVETLRQAVELQPNFAPIHVALGTTLRDLGRVDEAVACFARAVAIDPHFADAHDNLGMTLQALGRFDEALSCYEQAVRANPESAEAQNNLGTVLQALGRFDEAMACYERAVEFDPQMAFAHGNRAMIWLRRGNFEAGWPEYEWRWKCKTFSPFSGPQPRWDGGPLEGRTILLHAEQGLGDTLQFARYAPLVHAAGGRVLLQCQPQLAPLLARCPGVDTIVPFGAPLPEFDVYAPLMSLPDIFGTTVSNIPAPKAYIFADPALIESWRQLFAGIAGFRVGIAWQGKPGDVFDRLRSIRLEQFAELAAIPNLRLISLQKHDGAEQLASVSFPVVNLGPNFDESNGPFMDTAAIMKNLDLVIGPNTATVHLAGALGVPVWVTLPVASDWRWLSDRDDSPWYPSMRLFRQQTADDWADVFQRIAAALERLVAGGC